MKTIKKDVKKVKTKKKEPKKPVKKDRLKELEDLVVLMDKKILSLETEMDSMQDVFERIRFRMGI